MTDTSQTASASGFVFRSVAAVLICWFGSAAVVNSGDWFWRWIIDHTTIHNDFARWARLDATSRLRHINSTAVLAIGNSVTSHDFHIKRIATQLNLPSSHIQIAALPGAAEVDIAMMSGMIKRLKPKVVVHPVITWTLLEHSDWSKLRMYDPKIAWEILGGWFEFGSIHYAHARGLLMISNPLFLHRETILRTILSPDDTESNAIKKLDVPGHFAYTKFQLRRRDIDNNDIQCQSIEVNALLAVLNQTRKIGAVPVVVFAPTLDRISTMPNISDRADTCFAQLAKENSFIYIGKKVIGKYTRKDFADPMHLNFTGATRFTRTVTPFIAAAYSQYHENNHAF